MKKTLQLCSLILALLLSLAVFTACAEKDGLETNDGTEKQSTVESVSDSETESEFKPDVMKQDYGEEFFLQIQQNSNKPEYYFVSESSSDVLSEAVYTRQMNVSSYLGVEIVGTAVSGHNTYGEAFKTAVKNKDGSIDTLLSHSYMSLSQFISEGYLTDFESIPEINLDADYWSRNVMEGVAAGSRLYLGYSDFRLGYTDVIAFNKVMMEEYADSLDESVYDMVRNYRWTLDAMISLANLVSVDATGDGKTIDDTFGISGGQWNHFTNFLQASNIQLVDANEKGIYQLSFNNEQNNEKTSILIEKLLGLAKGNSAMFGYQNDPEKIISLTTERTLMMICATPSLTDSFVGSDLQFGVLPFPMYDETQKNVGYRSLDWGGWLCVPTFMRNAEMVGNTLEMLAFYSDDVQIAYYEKLLGKQAADQPDDRQMLSIVWDSICSDIGLTYSHIDLSLDNFLYMLPKLTYEGTENNYASYVKSYEKAANKKLEAFFKALEE